jgi:hypothetical protein
VASNGFILSVFDPDLTRLVERHVQLPIRIGRSSLNDVSVSHRLVSEFHARVEHVGGRLCVRDLGSKNGVLLESLGSEPVRRVAAHAPVDLEPYGYEFLLSPLLRVRLRPASAEEAARPRHGRAAGNVLGSSAFAPARARTSDASAPRAGGSGASDEPRSWSVPPPTPRHGVGSGYAMALPAVATDPAQGARPSRPAPPRAATLLAPGADVPAPAAPNAWDRGFGTVPAITFDGPAPPSDITLSLEALALHGLRELAASLLPGQPVENASDVVQLITKLHDTLEMFCRSFIPVREACSRFSTAEELERSSVARCRSRSGAYLAVERALTPSAVAAALIDWREPAQDAPLAVEHILADSMLQQLTTLHAALDGTQALLDELSPSQIESQAPRSPSVLSRLGLAGARERLLWDAFAERHRELANAGATFRELFGDAFSRLYEASHSGSGSPPP